jgi:type IV pilus assembly protein PilO
MAKIDIRNLPKPVRIAVAIVPSVILVALVVYLVILPKKDRIEVLKKEITKQEQDISKSLSMVQRLDQLRAENERIRAELKELEEYLPEEKEISSLLKQIEDLSREAELEILSWKPASKRRHSSGIVYEVPVSISLTGSYHRLGRFFSSLTQLNRIVNVNNISLGSPSLRGDEASLSVSFSAVTFTAIPVEGQGTGK